MRCSICGARCSCRNAGGGICCSCHPHKARVIASVTQIAESDRGADPHQVRWEELKRERDQQRATMRDV